MITMAIKSYQTTVNVKAYGAKGDGVTDDTAEIQAALNTGLPIFLPAGQYQVSSTLSIAANYQSIRGEGGLSQIRSSISNGTATLSLVGYDFCRLSSFLITNATDAGAAGNAIGVYSSGGIQWAMEDVIVRKQATAFSLQNAFIGSMRNCWSKYCTLGLNALNLSACDIALKIENYSQGIIFQGSGNQIHLLMEGDACTTSSTINGSNGNTISGYFEQNTVGSVSEFVIGGSSKVTGLRMNFTAAFSGTTAPFIQLDNVDGVEISGLLEKGNYPDYVTMTTSSKNVSLSLGSGSRGAQGGYLAMLPVTGNALMTPVNFFPDPYFWYGIPGSLTYSVATSAEETTIKPSWANRSLKVIGTVGNAYNYARKTLAFATYTHMAALKGVKVGVGYWVYTPDVSFYTFNSSGPGILVSSDGTGSPTSGSQNQQWFKGKWCWNQTELTPATDATQLTVDYWANWSATVATADTYAYFVGPLLWIGGLDNAMSVANGRLSHHPAVF